MSGISVIIPTIGRDSIRRTLDSIAFQMTSDDEIIIVGDGPCKLRKQMLASYGCSLTYIELPFRTWDWGGVPRNVGIQNAKRDYIAFMDDDDVYLPGAFSAMHDAILRYNTRTFLFRMQHQDRIIWNDPIIAVGNVGTQMLLMPNLPGKIPFWESFYEADCKFISDVAAQLPFEAPIMWMESIIATLEEHSRGDA